MTTSRRAAETASKDYTFIGIDRANGRDTAVLGELRDGVWHFKEIDPNNPEDFNGLKIDAVWVEESDMLP